MARARGEVLEVQPGRLLRVSFGWEGGSPVPGASTLTFTLEPTERGTRLTLVHDGLADAERADHDHGWEHYLGRLATVAAGGDPGPDPNATAPNPEAVP
jgi:uncharacterized protein YndB with AHSA1/START domain